MNPLWLLIIVGIVLIVLLNKIMTALENLNTNVTALGATVTAVEAEVARLNAGNETEIQLAADKVGSLNTRLVALVPAAE